MLTNRVSDDGMTIDVIPLKDDWEHNGPDCACGPELDPVGEDRLLLIRHHSLDGREVAETEPEPEPQTLTVELTVVDDHVDLHIAHEGPTTSQPVRVGMLITMMDLLDAHVGSLRDIDTD